MNTGRAVKRRVRVSPKVLVIAAAVLFVSGLFLLFAWHTYPAASGDAPVFLPTAIQIEAGEGWTNGISPFQYPVPLFPVVLSLLMAVPTPQSAFHVLGLLAVLNTALCALLFYRTVTRERAGLSWERTAFVVLSLFGVASWLVRVYSEGRPEIFASVLLLTSLLAVLYVWPRWHRIGRWVLASLLFSLMTASNPNGAVLFGLLIGACCSIFHRGRDWVLSMGAVASVPLLGLAALLVLFPTRAVRAGGHLAYVGDYVLQPDYFIHPIFSISQFWLVNPDVPLYGFVFLAALGGGAYLLYRNWRRMASPKWVVAFLVLFLFFGYYTAVRQPHRRYNLLLFSPVFFAVGLYVATHLRAYGVRYARAVQAGYAALLLLAGLGFAHDAVLFPSYLRHGMSMQQAQAAFEELGLTDRVTQKDEITVTRATWTLSREYEDLEYCPDLQRYMCGVKGEWLVLQQQHSGGAEPPAVEGYALHENRFVPATPRLLGVKMANSMPGYAFAIYERDHSADVNMEDRVFEGE